MICTWCGRRIYPAGTRWALADPPLGPSMHAGCRGAKATQDLIEQSLAAMRFAGDFSPWRLVGDLYEPGEPWGALGVQYDTHYGPMTFTVRTSVIDVSWDFFADDTTRTDAPMTVVWTETPPDWDDGHRGGAHVARPGAMLGMVVSDILRAAAACMAAGRQVGGG